MSPHSSIGLAQCHGICSITSDFHLQAACLATNLMPWCRQEYYRETYYQVKPLPSPTQPVQTLQILPSFAKPQTLAGPDGSIVFLEPEPYLHAPLDIVNHTADTALDSGSSSIWHQASTAKYRGQHIGMPEPMQAPLQRSDLLIAMTSAADRWVSH